jgi:hypothetical protein
LWEHTNFPTCVILKSEMVNKNDEFGMLPDLKGPKKSALGRRWALVFVSVSVTLAVAWLAFDQIAHEQQVLAKFSPSTPARAPLEDPNQERSQVASVSVTATTAGDSLVSAPIISAAALEEKASSSASQPPVVKPVVASPDAVAATFERWVQLWQSRDADAYLSLYDSARPDLQGHLKIRSERIRKAKFIDVSVSDVTYRQSGPSEITVRFVQSYQSDSYKSRDTKELVWRIDGPQAKIIVERLVN